MKIVIKKLPKSTIELTIEIPYDAYKKWEAHALQEINKNLKVAGFRSGHIPEDVVRQNVPESYVQERILDFVVPQTYVEAIRQEKIVPIAQPKVEIKQTVKKEGDTFIYTALVAVMPEVKIGDYKKIKVAREKVEVKPAQITEVIGQILDRFATFHAVERPAAMGDRAEVTFEGFDEKDRPIEKTKSANHPIVLGSKTFIEGFEEALVGMKKGETREFPLTFHKKYHDAALRGKKVKFRATLHILEEKKVPELTEETIEKIMKSKQTVEQFKKQVEADLKTEMEQRARDAQESKIIEEIVKMTKIELPDPLIDEELQFLLKNQQERVREQGVTWEQYLRHIKKTEADFFKDNRPQAEKNLIARLGVQTLIKEAKITVDDKEIEAKIQELIGSYPESERKKVTEYYQKGSKGYDRLHSHLAVDKLMAILGG
ncbi:trigger factor [Candidatus Peregrinibacteria bacterium]|nr:trigger factor [Candidatus Peregrinibacteria bacterium]